MKIAIDISQIVYEGSGVARYTHNLVEALLKYDQKNDYVFFFSSLRSKLNHQIETAINSKHELKKYRMPPTLLDLLWNKLHILPIDNFVGDVDLIITSDWTEPPAKTKKITIVHDLVYLRYPKTLSPKIVSVQKRRLNWVTRESELIIADSQNTKNDLITLLKIPQEKINVIYPTVSHPRDDNFLTPKEHKEILNKYRLTRPFILTVGKIEPRKNIGRLIEAFLKSQLKDIDLIIVGTKGWSADYYQTGLHRRALVDKQHAKNIRFLGFISDKELYALYQSAQFFIMPSIYEGFGYPVVEAMSFNCPVATSNTSSLKEIAEGFALLFNPYDEHDIAKTLIKLAGDKELRHRLAEKAFIHAQNFSSEKFMHNLSNLLNLIEKDL